MQIQKEKRRLFERELKQLDLETEKKSKQMVEERRKIRQKEKEEDEIEYKKEHYRPPEPEVKRTSFVESIVP